MPSLRQSKKAQRGGGGNRKLRIALTGIAVIAIMVLSRSYDEVSYQRRMQAQLRTTTTEEAASQQKKSSSLLTVKDTVTIPKSDPFAAPDVHERIAHFRDTALKFRPITDKIGITSEHRYHNMYGMFLLPYAAHKPDFKMLEIGLGCNMGYGPGASVAVWKELFPNAKLWEAEYVAECVEKSTAKGQLDGINVLVGDQADIPTLDSWIQKSGGQFDVIIDDGGHHNCQIGNSFDKLWPELQPGGYYFIEDLHVGRSANYIGAECGSVLFTQRLLEWSEHLMFLTNTYGQKFKYPLPKDILFISCQAEACVIGKKKSVDINDPVKKPPA